MKIKWNWGTGVVVAFACFIAFIGYFIVKVQTDRAYDSELVVDEYYKKDARFETVYQEMDRGRRLPDKPKIQTVPNGVTITFPKAMRHEDCTGTVSFYRPSAKRLDFEVPIASASDLLIPKTRLVGGLWNITLEWKSDGVTYSIAQTLYL